MMNDDKTRLLRVRLLKHLLHVFVYDFAVKNDRVFKAIIQTATIQFNIPYHIDTYIAFLHLLCHRNLQT